MINSEVVPAEEIRAALDRMVGSEMFRDSPQLAVFLRFVTEAELRGESDRIKGYTIGVEALGRGKDFDPQTDPIVRVEATRLRRTIERYYAGPGASDPVIITLSPGSYVPTFRLRKPASLISMSLSATRSRLLSRIVIGFTIFAVAAVFAAYFIYPRVSAYLLTRSLQPGNGMPTILLEPLGFAGTPLQDVVPQGALIEKLRDAISQFDTLNAVLAKDVADPKQSALRQSIRFRLTGLVEYRDDGPPNLRFQLFDAEDYILVWSRQFERFAASGGRAAAEDAVVTEVVTALAQSYGVIRAHERNRYLARGRGDLRYQCILETSDSLRSFDPALHRKAKACIESLLRADASYASGLAYLAVLYLREYQFDIGVSASERASLDRASVLIRQYIERQPSSSRGYQILSAILFARGEFAPALAAIERAVELNRYDMTVLSDYGGRLVMTGEVDKGLEMLERAAKFGTQRPSWYNFYLFLGYYLKSDLAKAGHYASQITPERYPLGHVAHALAAHATGNRELAREALQKLIGLRPAWRDDTVGELRKLIGSEAIVQRLANDLAAAGLGTTLR